MSGAGIAPKLLMRNVPLSLSMSRSLRLRNSLTQVSIHVQSVEGWLAPMDGRYAAVSR